MGCVAAPAILHDAEILGLLRSPFAAQGRSYRSALIDKLRFAVGFFPT